MHFKVLFIFSWFVISYGVLLTAVFSYVYLSQIKLVTPSSQNFRLYVALPDTTITSTDIEIADAMATYWTNFAKYRDPNGKTVPKWPEFTNAKPYVMHFGKTPHVGSVPSFESMKILDTYFAWRRTSEGKEWAK